MAAAPERMCAACRARSPKAELWRFVRAADGSAVLDAAAAQSRGAYLCRSAQCVRKAKKTRALERALGASNCGALYDRLLGLTEETHG